MKQVLTLKSHSSLCLWVIFASITLYARPTLSAGTVSWTAVFGSYYSPYSLETYPAQVIGTYTTKTQAIAAIHNFQPNPPGYIYMTTAPLKSAGSGSMSANTVTYLFTAPTVSLPMPAFSNFSVRNGTGGPTEAAAVAAATLPGPCVNGKGGTQLTFTPAGPWVIDPTYGASETRAYTATEVSEPGTPPYACGTSTTTVQMTAERSAPACPSGYSPGQYVSGTQQFTCLDYFTGTISGAINDCPSNGGPATTVGDPCDVSTGEFSQTETDYASSGVPFTRSYHSATLESNNMGIGWTHNYGGYLVVSNGAPQGLLRPDGHQDAIQSISGEYVSLSGAGVHLQASGSDWVAYLGDGSSEVYSSTGQLIQKLSAGGQITNLTYNTAGLLSSVTGPFGHSLQLAYDSSNRLSTVTEPDGSSTITYAYDTNNNLVSATYPDGSVRQYQYQNSTFPNNLTGILDESDTQFVTVQYDPTTSAVVSSQQAGGAQAVSISYGSNTAVVTDSLGATHTYTFTSGTGYSPRVTSLTYNSLLQSFSVPSPSADPQQRVTQLTDANGNVTTYTYDINHLTSKTDAYGTAVARTTSYQYLGTNTTLPTLITESLKTTTFAYFSGTNLVQTKTITDPTTGTSRSWGYTYDSYGRTLTAKGPRTDLNSTTTYAYYTCTAGQQCGQVQTLADAVGNVTTYNTYNAFGQPLTITDPNGVVTTLSYDARQRLISRQIATETTNFTYYPTGLLKQVTLPDNSTVVFTYDGAHRVTQVKDGLGNSIQFTLDSMGNRTAESSYDPNSALHRTHSRTINVLNQIHQEINAAGTAAVTTSYAYDNSGNRTSISAPLSRNTTDAYDALNRITQTTDPAEGITKVSYDANDNATSVTDPRGLRTIYTNNGLGDRLALSSPDTGTTGYAYDSAGNLSSSTSARGATASYTYDALNRMSQVSYSMGGTTDQSVVFSYDAGGYGKGHLTGASDANHAMTYSYDALGRVVSKKQVVGTISLMVGYAYTNGDLTTITTPSGKTITYTYNGNHQISGVSVNGIPVLSAVTYEPFGAVNGWTWGNGTTTMRAYNTDGNIANISSAATKDYSYDSALRITGITDGANSNLSWTYGYDGLDRVNSASAAAQSLSFTYDPNGNRLTQGGSAAETLGIASTGNQLSTVMGGLSRTYAYDPSGNTLSFAGTYLTYNDGGRIYLVNSGAASFVYNALGQRIKKSSASSTTLFAYDEAGHLVGEYDGSGNLIQEIVWLGDTPVATVRIETCGLSIFYIHTDHLNTPRRITRRSTADVVWSWESDPFGTAVPNQNPSGLGVFTFNLRFPGQYYDSETGLNYNYFRDYDPAVGRYVESDPIGLGAGVNTYAYGSLNPNSIIDPFGLRPPTDTEVQFIRKYIGPCLNPYSLNIKVRTWGNTSRALSLGSGFTSFPSYDFVGDSGNNSLNLDSSVVASVFGHEALHQWQRASGVNVTGQALRLQAEYSLHIADPYQYQPSNDPDQMLQTFLNGNVEQQGQIFQDYLFAQLNGQDVSAYALVALYVKSTCACLK
jgi:RHS repeat-associated protein